MKSLLTTTAALLLATTPAMAEILVKDAYVRSSTPNSPSGAAFMILENTGTEDDRLIGAMTPAAEKAELHSHTQDDNGVMRMGEIEGGVPLAAGATHVLKRGADHVMLMGITAPLEQGADIPLTLIFEQAGEVEVTVHVDHERKANHGAMGHGADGHGTHGHDDADHGSDG